MKLDQEQEAYLRNSIFFGLWQHRAPRNGATSATALEETLLAAEKVYDFVTSASRPTVVEPEENGS